MNSLIGASALVARSLDGITHLDVDVSVYGVWNYEDFHLRVIAHIPFHVDELLGFRENLRNMAFVKRSLIRGVQAWHQADPSQMIAQMDHIVLDGPIANRLQLLWWCLVLLWGIFAGSIGCCCCQMHWVRRKQYC